MNKLYQLKFSQSAYQWTARLMTVLSNNLSINIKLHDEHEQIQNGDIFMFNHFARFETFIPQFLIYQKTGVMCRSIAASEFFTDDDTFGNYLISLGAVPNDYHRILPFLAEEILRGHKVVVFPEGGMVKDRRVLSQDGEYSIFSRSQGERRKHHTGAAALGTTLELLKSGILHLKASGDLARFEAWAEHLGFDSTGDLLKAVEKPTSILPANITFYPIRLSENFLQKGAETLNANLNDKHIEELLIEGNMLLKDTDMDIRLGAPVYPHTLLSWWEKLLFRRSFKTCYTVDDVFHIGKNSRSIDGKLLARSMKRNVSRCSDKCMQEMYINVTINLAHLASLLIIHYVDQKVMQVEGEKFNKTLYLAIKSAQKAGSLKLHRSLLTPSRYQGIIEGKCAWLVRFFKMAEQAKLVVCADNNYRFLPKLLEEHEFDQVRIENPVLVYANEASPIAAVKNAIADAISTSRSLTPHQLALNYFDDEQYGYRYSFQKYRDSKFAEINNQETATQSGEPYLLLPHKTVSTPSEYKTGVVLVHGFLASPAELRELGEKLLQRGYPVIGVRLSGHGTSPYDLREKKWEDWMAPVRRGYEIMSLLSEKVVAVGFSTGGTLALRLASDKPEKLAGVSVASAPLLFKNKNLIFVPLVHGVNRFTRWVSSLEGVMPFRPNQSEHPDLNYKNIPIRGLYELRKLVENVKKHLPNVICPVQIIQGSNDRVVDPVSADLIFEALGSTDKTIHLVDTKRHGVLNENIAGAQDTVISFINKIADIP